MYATQLKIASGIYLNVQLNKDGLTGMCKAAMVVVAIIVFVAYFSSITCF